MKMLNLLPQSRKDSIQLELLNKFVIQNGVVILIGMVLLVLFLAANLFIINIYDEINQAEINQVISGEVNTIIQETKTKIDKNHLEVNQSVKDIKNRTPIWEYLRELNLLLPDKIYYSKITLDSENIILEGLALNRGDLVSFGESLEESDVFEKIEMPISNLTSQENVNFKINLSLNKK